MRKYLADLIFGANDGIITTLAVVSGVVGAALPVQVILILGFANLVADGFSMAASNVLARRSDAEAGGAPPPIKVAARHGAATFIGFTVAGLVPLLAYLLPWFEGGRFGGAVVLALLTLFAVGAGRARFSDRRWTHAGFEMLAIGTVAAAVAYLVGAAAAAVVAGL